MAGFTYRLEHEDGTPADPPTFHTVVPNWQAGDTIPLGADRTLRVIETRFEDEELVVVVEPVYAATCGRRPAPPGNRAA
jgi:hypothetical protein